MTYLRYLYGLFFIALLGLPLPTIGQNALSTEEEETRPKFSRPEDRGIDFSTFDTPTLLGYLQNASDKIERRKAARTLGDRAVAGQYQASEADQQIINTVVKSYVNQSTNPDVHVREEAYMQMQRLWHLAVPGLVESLANEEVGKMEFAAKVLVLFRSEAAITGMVERFEAVPKVKDKQYILGLLGKMVQPQPVLVRNRKRVPEATFKASYQRLVEPAVKTYMEERGL